MHPSPLLLNMKNGKTGYSLILDLMANLDKEIVNNKLTKAQLQQINSTLIHILFNVNDKVPFHLKGNTK